MENGNKYKPYEFIYKDEILITVVAQSENEAWNKAIKGEGHIEFQLKPEAKFLELVSMIKPPFIYFIKEKENNNDNIQS